MDLQVDYRAVFDALPLPIVLLSRDFVILDMNRAYLEASGRQKEQLVGVEIFTAFPDNPADPGATGVRNLRASLDHAIATGEIDRMALQKYDVESPDQPGVFEARFWCPVNSPVLAGDGEVALIAHCAEEVTDRVRKFVASQAELRT